MSRKPRVGVCVYCGRNGKVTSDHVPPKCLFPPETRLNLITVNACSICHDSFKLDDEYFRVTLAFRDDLPDGTETQFLRTQTKKTLCHPAARKFQSAIRAAMLKVSRHSSSGIYLGEAMALCIDSARVIRTAERIVRGLYGEFFGVPLPQTYDLTVNLLDMQRDDSALQNLEIQECLMLLRQDGGRKTFGKVFDVWYAKADDDEYSSFWMIHLHGVFRFFGFTIPRDN